MFIIEVIVGGAVELECIIHKSRAVESKLSR